MINYVVGDATSPPGPGNRIIAHVCNDIGRMGSGFALAVYTKWPKVKEEYLKWFQSGVVALGEVQFVQVEDDIWVANMIGQHQVKGMSKGPPIRYKAVDACLHAVAKKAKELNASVHMPRIGCGLAEGEWSLIEPIIERNIDDSTVYDFVL